MCTCMIGSGNLIPCRGLPLYTRGLSVDASLDEAVPFISILNADMKIELIS